MTVERFARPLVPRAGGLARVRDVVGRWRAERDVATDLAIDMWLEQRDRADLRFRWREACRRAGLGEVDMSRQGARGRVSGLPAIERIDIGPPITLQLTLPPGVQLVQLEAVAGQLAEGLGVPRLRFERFHGGRVLATLIRIDPLAGVLRMPVASAGPLVLGRTEFGQLVSVELEDLPHVAVQGQTGSGKSSFVYSALGQLYGRPDVAVCGVDPSGLLFRGMPASPFRASGLESAPAIEAALAAVVAEMDARCAEIPAATDRTPCGPGTPFLVCVLEELPGLLAHLEVVDVKTARRVRALIGRIAAEGRKVGLRLVLLAQRFEAAVIGGDVRANAGLRLSFRVDGADSLRLLHGSEVPADVLAAHVVAEPGVALINAPGVPLGRLRVPLLDYDQYAHGVELVARRPR